MKKFGETRADMRTIDLLINKDYLQNNIEESLAILELDDYDIEITIYDHSIIKERYEPFVCKKYNEKWRSYDYIGAFITFEEIKNFKDDDELFQHLEDMLNKFIEADNK